VDEKEEDSLLDRLRNKYLNGFKIVAAWGSL
jgi:hypothetical protein